jgi:outer membrane immunogenic protein
MRRAAIALTASAILLSAVLAAGIGQAAFAADLPARPAPYAAPVIVPIYNWSGCYLGANVGGQYGSDKITTTSSVNNFGAAGAAFLDGLTSTTINPQGVIGGVQGGCNAQFASFVIGFEADASWLYGVQSRTVTVGAGAPAPFLAGDFMTNEVKATFLATARARAGVALDRVLLFVTGGAAFGTIKTSDSLGTFGGLFVSTTSTTANRTGWTVGAGLEYAMTQNWLFKAEYLYVDLGSFDAPIACALICIDANDTTAHHKYTDHIGRIGINYKFGGPVYAKY